LSATAKNNRPFAARGYNLKNARNGKSASKIHKWLSLRPLEFKSKFIRQFEFSENLETCMENVAGEHVSTFSIQIFLLF